MTAILPGAPPLGAGATAPGATPLAPATRWWPAFTAVYAGQLSRARVARVPLLFVAAFQSVGIMLLLRGVVAERATGAAGLSGDLTRESVVAGSTVLVVAFVALNLLAQRFGALKASGALDYYAALPIPGSAVVLGTATSYATFTVPGTVVTALGGCALFQLPYDRLWVLVPVVLLAAPALAGVGALVGLLAPRQEIATVAGQLGMSIVLFVGIIPADRLPEVARLVRVVVPASYAVDALAATFRPTVDWGGVVADLGVCAAVAVATLALAAFAFTRLTHGHRRRGQR